ncbi:hypothetical protein [Ilumatobacter sp.]|uniref:hypothetical protein n=1 Tax=Ilumatobacter sp. TaxID=1967498 RepID=UPI003C3C3980
MFTSDDMTLDCRTCLAANTTACGDCVVQHLLANDAGPIEFVPNPQRRGAGDTERVVQLFARAGMLDDEPHYVPFAEFESSGVPQMTR